MGVVHNPISGELFKAALGTGAYCNGIPMSVSKTPESLEQALILTEYPNKHYEEQTTEVIKRIIHNARGVRMLGSAAMNLCHVASGRADCYIQLYGIKAWDICAGIVIVREAGGFCCDQNGSESLDLSKGRIIAANSHFVSNQIIKII